MAITIKPTEITFPDGNSQTIPYSLSIARTYSAVQTYSDGIKTDTVLEKTANAGVTVAGNLLKAGAVNDGKGDVRQVVGNFKSAAYTAILSDSGKSIITNANVTIPNNVFSRGDVVTIVSYSGSNLTITLQPTTSFISGSATARTSVTLRPVGVATIFFINGTYAIIAGSVA